MIQTLRNPDRGHRIGRKKKKNHSSSIIQRSLSRAGFSVQSKRSPARENDIFKCQTPSNFIIIIYYLLCLSSCTLQNNIKSKLPVLWSRALQIVSDDNKQWKDCALFGFGCLVRKWRCELWFTDEQEAVQKRTFTKWINSHLAKVRESVSIPTATASIVLSLNTNTGAAVWGLKTSPPHRFQLCCSSTPHVTWLQKTLPSWSWDWLCQLRPRTRSFLPACLSYSSLICQVSWLARRICSDSGYYIHITALCDMYLFFIPPAGHCL